MVPFLYMTVANCHPELHSRPPRLRASYCPEVNQCDLQKNMPCRPDGLASPLSQSTRCPQLLSSNPERVLKENLSRNATAPQLAGFLKSRGEVALSFLIPCGVELELQPAPIFRGSLGRECVLSADTMTVPRTLQFP